MITADELRDLLDYDPQTGQFTWKTTVAKHVKPGRRAGYTERNGYVQIRIRGKLYKAHRLAWLYMTGEWPTLHIDHINGVTGDNRFANLREATVSENQRNQRRSRRNSSGLKGVTWDKRRKKWAAQIRVEGKQHNLGRFTSKHRAAAAYDRAAVRLHGEFARTNRINPLRDWFAAQALRGLAMNKSTQHANLATAYSIADAMLKEREKRND